LRELTRDTKRFPVLFEENVDYGFRRNSLGIRPIALGIAVAVLVISFVMLFIGEGHSVGTRWGSSAVVSAIAVAYWSFVVGEEWVRRSGERYADCLFESIATLIETDMYLGGTACD
jgi:hypothetical protein